MDTGLESEDDSQESDYDVDSDAESVCSTLSTDSLHVAEPTFKVFVKQFPPSVKREDIQNHLKVCGLSDNSKSIRIFHGKDKRSKGCGYIEFTPHNTGRRAISILNGSLLLGKHKIEAKKFHDRRKNKSPKRKPVAKCPSNREVNSAQLPVVAPSTPKEDDGEFCNVFVGSLNTNQLPPSIQSSHLQRLFEDFQPNIQRVYIVTDQKTKQSKGYGFVTFKSKQAAGSAILKLNGSHLHGCQLKVDFAKTKKDTKTSGANQQDKPNRNSSPSSSDTGHTMKKKQKEKGCPPISIADFPSPCSECKVFVGGMGKALPDSVQPHHLRTHFAEFQAAIVNAYIPRDCGNKQYRRHGFVVFSSTEEAERAVQVLNGSKLHGCPIKVQIGKKYRTHASKPVSTPDLATTPVPAQPQFPLQLPLQPSSTICLSNLNPAIDRETITTLCGGKITDLQIINVDSNCQKAIITFSSVVDARDAIDQFDGKEFLSQTVSASYSQPLNQPHHPPVQPVAVSATYMFPVKVTHLAVTVDEAALHGLFEKAGEIVECRVFSTSTRYALVNFKHDYEAEMAVNMFDGRVIDGMKVNVSQKPPKIGKDGQHFSCSPVTVQVSNLNPQLQVHEHWKCLTEVFSSYQSAKVENVCPPDAYIKFGNEGEAYSSVDLLHQSIIGGSTVQVAIKLKQQDEQLPKLSIDERGSADTQEVIQLTSAQCNLLTAVNSAGSSLYQELSDPFETNPNVKIELLLADVSVRFTGKQDAVDAAHSHFRTNLQRYIPVELHFVQALMDISPDLPKTMTQRYGITLSGFQEDAALLKLDGSQSGVSGARSEIDGLIAHFQKSVAHTRVSLTHTLLMSAKRRLKDEGIVASLFHTLGCPDVTVCSFSSDVQEKAVKIMRSKPSTKYVPFQPNPSMREIPLGEIATEFSVSVDMNEAEKKIYIEGFVKQDVLSAHERIENHVLIKSVQFSPIVCSSEQILYLRCKIQNQKEATQQILDTLPAEVVFESNRQPYFKGSPIDIESSQKQLSEGPLFRGLKHKSFTFKAHHKFSSQIEQHILEPVKREHPDFEYVKIGSGEPSIKKGRRGSTKAEESEFTITIFSHDLGVFEGAVSALEAVSPCVKTLNLPHTNAVSCVRQKMKVNEQQYRVRIIITNNSGRVLIFGLSEEEASLCLYELREQIDSTVVIEKYIKLDHNQARYLQQKKSEDWKELQVECKTFKLFDHRRQETDTALIRVEGTVQQVRAVEQGLAVMTGGDYFVKSFTVVVAKKYNRMWLKHWDTVIKEKEQSHDFIVEVSRKRSTEVSEESPTVEYEFTICGGDENGSVEVHRLLSEPQTLQKTIELSEKATKDLDKARKEKELRVTDQYIVDMFIEFKRSRVVLTAPTECSDDLEAAEEEIQRYIGNCTLLEKEITVDDPVIGLILHSKSKTSPHLVYANQLSKPYGISVQCLRRPRCGLLLRGSQDSIVKVEPLICQKVIAQILSTVDEMTFTVEPALVSFFATPEFNHFNAKIRDELCVLGTFPKLKKNNPVIRSVYLKTTTSASCIKLDICKGNLTNEEANVDALVNAANEDLHHAGGLARNMVEVGGDAIQKESNLYIQMNGKLKPGNVVCLGAGNLSCKKILHAVGPRWADGTKEEEQTLYFTVLSCLQACQREGLESVAFPALSTGIFAVPDDVCIRASMKAIRDFCQITPNTCVTNVRFVLLQNELAGKFALALDSDVLLGCTVPATRYAPPAVMSHTYTWEWMDDNGSFIPYSSDLTLKLNDQYGHIPQGSLQFLTNKRSYIVNFSAMMQTNVETNFQRKVRRIPTASAPSTTTQSSVRWKFCNDMGRLTPYIPSDSQAIEAMFQKRVPGQLTIKGKVYGFDFNQMFQVNMETSYKRPIERTVSSTAEGQGISSEDLPKKSLRMTRKMTVILRGPMANLPLAKSKLDDKLKGALRNGDITFPISLERKVISIVQRHMLTFSITNAEQADRRGMKKRITFQGLSHSVNKATSAIQEEIINYHTAAAEESAVEVPPEWQPQTQNLELCPVTRGLMEWNKVESRFKITCPSETVIQITRIQNKWLWERYAQHKQRLAYKNSGIVNEKELFHGTRNNDPKLIYEGEDGFDMRYSAQGMWGLANYFAVNASYSNSYAYTRSDGSREMFLVNVLTGESFQCPSNPNLRMPPEKPGVGSGKLQFAKVRYDSVTGTTKGSQVFMTYDNDKAYPAYLILYK